MIPLSSDRRQQRDAPPPELSPDARLYDDLPAPPRRRDLPLLGRVALWQGAYYAVTGAWALLHIRSFMWVTGPKTDAWLVKTVGALVCVIGGVLLASARKPEPTEEAAALGIAAPLALAAVEVVYAARGRIRPVYALDAVVQCAIAALWCSGLKRRTRSPRATDFRRVAALR